LEAGCFGDERGRIASPDTRRAVVAAAEEGRQFVTDKAPMRWEYEL